MFACISVGSSPREITLIGCSGVPIGAKKGNGKRKGESLWACRCRILDSTHLVWFLLIFILRLFTSANNSFLSNIFSIRSGFISASGVKKCCLLITCFEVFAVLQEHNIQDYYGRWLWSLWCVQVQLFGQNTGDVRHQPPSRLVLWC